MNKTTPKHIIHISNWSNVTRWDRIKPQIHLKWCKVNERTNDWIGASVITVNTREQFHHEIDSVCCSLLVECKFAFWWVGKCQIRIGLQHFCFIYYWTLFLSLCLCSLFSEIVWNWEKKRSEETNRLFNIIEIHLDLFFYRICNWSTGRRRLSIYYVQLMLFFPYFSFSLSVDSLFFFCCGSVLNSFQLR